MKTMNDVFDRFIEFLSGLNQCDKFKFLYQVYGKEGVEVNGVLGVYTLMTESNNNEKDD